MSVYDPPTRLDIGEWLRRHHDALTDFRDPRTGARLSHVGSQESRNTGSDGHHSRGGPIRNTCALCGEEFEARRVDSRYCSDAHRQRAYRERSLTKAA